MSSIQNSLAAKEQTLHKIFSDDYAFTIPEYQRPYSWGSEQAQALLDDLIGHIEHFDGDIKKATPYFLGCIVLIRNRGSSESDVVDGQQRLTTLVILLSALRETIDDPNFSRSIGALIYEAGNDLLGTKNRYRLNLRDRDSIFFQDHIQKPGGFRKLVTSTSSLPEPRQRIRENAQIFERALSNMDQKGLEKLAKFIVGKTALVVVETYDFDSAYRIFGTLNSRGLDLEPTDILKSRIIGAIEEADRKSYADTWDGVEEAIGRRNMIELFAHLRSIKSKISPQDTLLNEVDKYLNPSQNAALFISETLVPMAQHYSEMTSANYRVQTRDPSGWKYQEQVNTSLYWLGQVGKEWIPAGLAYWSKHRDSPEKMAVFFHRLETLLYSMMTRKTTGTRKIVRLAQVITEVESGNDQTGGEAAVRLSPREQRLFYSALDGPLYSDLGARKLKNLLLRIENLMTSDQATYKDGVGGQALTIEHVLPQNPSPESPWIEWIPSDEDRELWTDRIGNLAILNKTKNSSAGARDLDTKKIVYFTKGGVSPFAITAQIQERRSWTVEVLQERQNHLLSILTDYFSLTEMHRDKDQGNEERRGLGFRRPNFSFRAVGIPSGSTIYHIPTGAPATSSGEGNEVLLHGKRMTLIEATRTVIGDPEAMIGRATREWRYGDLSLADIYDSNQ